MPTLEDEILQRAVAETVSAIYKVDFLGFSHGFRLRRNPHQGLASLHTAIMSQRVSWILDADIGSFFDSVDHEWLLRMLLMHTPLTEQHRWLSSVLRGQYGCFGVPHDWRSLNGFLRDARRTWFNCLKRQRRENRAMGLVRDYDDDLPFTPALNDSPSDTTSSMMQVTSGKSRVRGNCLPGSARAKPNGRATRA